MNDAFSYHHALRSLRSADQYLSQVRRASLKTHEHGVSSVATQKFWNDLLFEIK